MQPTEQPVSMDTVQKAEDWPTVTVQVCTYGDRAGMLRRALESVLAQTYDDFDVVVVNDGVPELATTSICEEFKARFFERDIDLYLMWTDEQTGYYTIPRNLALNYCSGDYIAFLDDDNEWYPHTLQSYVDAIEDGVQWPDFVYGRRFYVKDKGAPDEHEGQQVPEGESPFVELTEDSKAILAISPLMNFIDASELMVSRGALYWMMQQHGFAFNEKRRRFGDWELVTRGLHFGSWRGKAIDKVVMNYHWHSSNVQLTRKPHEVPVTRVSR